MRCAVVLLSDAEINLPADMQLFLKQDSQSTPSALQSLTSESNAVLCNTAPEQYISGIAVESSTEIDAVSKYNRDRNMVQQHVYSWARPADAALFTDGDHANR